MVRGMVIEADLTCVEGALRRGVRVAVDENGRIGAVGPDAGETTLRLNNQALLPGMISAHSHAFQRGLRGRVEVFPRGAGDFWSWREAMYGLVEGLDAEAFRRLCVQCFREMLDAGITTVGEFHYLHHSREGADFALDREVVAAAEEAGIRLVLLSAYYRTGDIGRPVEAAQRRFASPDVASFVASLERTRAALRAETQSLGIAAHSIRAVPPPDLCELASYARSEGMVLHMHAAEQRREVADCRRAYGRDPLEILTEAWGEHPGATAVHATHSEPEILERFVASGGRVCLCPLTEADLGDGLPAVEPLRARAGAVCLGTDMNLRIDMTEEVRLVEYAHRLVREQRGVWTDDQGRCAERLWALATENGAAALGILGGRIAAGYLADLISLDLAHPALAGAAPDAVLEAFLFGAGAGAISGVCVGGRWIRAPGSTAQQP